MTKKATDGDGQYTDETFVEVGRAVGHIGAAMAGHRQLQVELVGLNVRRPKVRGGEFLIVAKGLDAEGVPCVAFHSGFTLEEAIRGLDGRLRNGSLKWREDEYMA